MPCSSACRHSVPITSSASNPSTSKTGTAKARIRSFTRWNWGLSSGGVGSRWALYSAKRRCLKVGAEVSKAMAQWVGLQSCSARRNTLVKPYTPVTSSPVAETVRCRCTDMARKDRCTMACPSINMSRGWSAVGNNARLPVCALAIAAPSGRLQIRQRPRSVWLHYTTGNALEGWPGHWDWGSYVAWAGRLPSFPRSRLNAGFYQLSRRYKLGRSTPSPLMGEGWGGGDTPHFSTALRTGLSNHERAVTVFVLREP